MRGVPKDMDYQHYPQTYTSTKFGETLASMEEEERKTTKIVVPAGTIKKLDFAREMEKLMELQFQELEKQEKEQEAATISLHHVGDLKDNLPVKCECGSAKLGLPHSTWCPIL